MTALQAFTGQYKQILDFAKSVPGVEKAAANLSGTTKRLHSAAMDAAGLMKKGSLDAARTILDGAADEARGGSEIRHENAHAGGGKVNVKVVYTTKTKI
ncbi:hypothetical protein NX059_010493 [Plenodomus lindquistii]|nr:hypothetical protein NX059_010493 [Plenodomus lindquistii]